jgi:hypothetical protein
MVGFLGGAEALSQGTAYRSAEALRHPKATPKSTSKASGQECPFHTGNVNVKANAAGVRDSHLSQKTRKMGHPRLMRVRFRQNQSQRQRAGAPALHNLSFLLQPVCDG